MPLFPFILPHILCSPHFRVSVIARHHYSPSPFFVSRPPAPLRQVLPHLLAPRSSILYSLVLHPPGLNPRPLLLILFFCLTPPQHLIPQPPVHPHLERFDYSYSCHYLSYFAGLNDNAANYANHLSINLPDWRYNGRGGEGRGAEGRLGGEGEGRGLRRGGVWSLPGFGIGTRFEAKRGKGKPGDGKE